MWATGDNSYYQLGLGHNNNINSWTKVGTDNDWKKIEGNTYSAVGIKTDGTLWGAGTSSRYYNVDITGALHTTFYEIDSDTN